jgi:heme oxygenase (biliverdin-IX-beta and delta-forming)
MPLSKAHPTIDDYRDHLLLLNAWLGPVEAWLSRFDDGPQNRDVLSPVRRVPLIESDLRHASIAPLTHVEQIEPVTFPPSAHNDSAYRWGVCYVVEGSQLGGAVLYKRLRAQLAPHPLHFLGADGVPVGPRWQQFVHALRVSIVTDEARARACEGAVDAFDSLLSLLPSCAKC